MIDWLTELPVWMGIAVSMLFATAAGLCVYLVSHRLLRSCPSDELKDPIGGLFRVIGMLVSLMLSLAFAEVVVGLRSVQASIQQEAQAIVATFKDLRRFDEEGTRPIQLTLIEYAQAIVDDDWPALDDDRLGARSSEIKGRLVDQALALEPETPAQEKLWSSIIADLDRVTDARMIRLGAALGEPPVYIYVVFFGFLVTMACFGGYRPRRQILTLVVLYTGFVGLVLYMILSLSDPFHGGLGVEPTAIEHLIPHLQARMA